jgi:Zn-dependent peptidase ImmA (M78 family)
MTIQQFKRHHAIRVMNWCRHNIGVNGRRKYYPALEWSVKGYDNDCGEYDFDDNVIGLNKNMHRSVIDIIHTIIHEWCHYKQSTKKYYEYSETYNYQDNPLEIQANELADKMKWKCRKDLFR